MSELFQKQVEFTSDVAKLLLWATYNLADSAKARGDKLEFTLGDVYEDQNPSDKRPPSCWIHRPGSVHSMRLAVDINMFLNGKYVTTCNSYYEDMGRHWRGLNPLNSWGGDFNDPNHFSRPHNGMR